MRPHFAILALLLALAAAYFSGAHFFEQSEDEPEERAKALGDRIKEAAHRRPNPQSSQRDEPVDNETADGFPEGALRDEAIVTFASESALEELLESASDLGIEIIGLNHRLKAIRLRLKSPLEFDALAASLGHETEIDYNFVVLVPEVSSPALDLSKSAPFGEKLFEWIGAPEDRTGWGKGIRVAVLDTLVENHAVFESTALDRIDLAVDTSGGGESHGTAVASLVAGAAPFGLAPEATLICIPVLDGEGIGNNFTLAEGIVTAVDAGAGIVTMSLGSYGYSKVLESAVAYASSKGAVLVAAAGNDGIDVLSYPARFDEVIAVGATDAEGDTPAFSNYSPQLDLVAPGVGVIAAWGADEVTGFSGTSAAAPIVAGAIAGLLSLEPDLQPQEAAALLSEFANDQGAPGTDPFNGQGAINIQRIRERHSPGIRDAAIAGLYIDSDTASDQHLSLVVTVQNRGTEPIKTLSIQLSVRGQQDRDIYIGYLDVGSTESYQLDLDTASLRNGEGVQVAARIDPNGARDIRSENDARQAVLRIAAPAETSE